MSRNRRTGWTIDPTDPPLNERGCSNRRRAMETTILALVLLSNVTLSYAFQSRVSPSIYPVSRRRTASRGERHMSIVEPPSRSSVKNDLVNTKANYHDDNIPQTFMRQMINLRNGRYEHRNSTDASVPRQTQVDEHKTLIRDKRSIWRRRNARSADEGIRREKTTSVELSQLLQKANQQQSKGYVARTIAGLLHALAEEVSDLQVQVDARNDTPLWNKHIDSLKISFSRLGFKPLKLGGLDYPGQIRTASNSVEDTLLFLQNPDEAFSKMDADNSGALDRQELAQALVMATSTATVGNDDLATTSAMEDLANELVEIYDINGDGVVDREEYQSMVEDMAALREQAGVVPNGTDEGRPASDQKSKGLFSKAWSAVSGLLARGSEHHHKNGETEEMMQLISAHDKLMVTGQNHTGEIILVPDKDEIVDEVSRTIGSITLTNLKLDLRRLVFGGLPLIKRITPGGPLILEPFTTTVEGSFSRDDIMNSFLLDAGLRRLVARALRRRVRSFRDFIDGALFHGRSWTMASASAPIVEVPRLTNVEFDKQDRLVITGRAKIRTRSDAPQIEQAFKVRTKIGTRKDGRTIRLVEPELAFVLECPRAWERNIAETFYYFGLEKPERPEPLYSFFPIYSPFKVDDNDGFYLGEDNTIRSIFVKDGALRFELSAVIRPGRFLGNHYIAFSIPNRTFIVTLDRVKEGMRAARSEKRANDARKRMLVRRNGEPEDAVVLRNDDIDGMAEKERILEVEISPPRSFFGRFVDGYLQAEQDDENERVLDAIRDFFGKQHINEN